MPDIKNQKYSLNNRPFRLGTTSFIYPDDILPNVRKIGGVFDEIELLVFESIPYDVLPSKAVVDELAVLSEDLCVTYNVHLPVDISISDPWRAKRDTAVKAIKKVKTLFSPLNPTTHTLHLDYVEQRDMGPNRSKWEKRIKQSLKDLLDITGDLSFISVETLEYPVEYLEDLIKEFDLNVTIDAGHHLKCSQNLGATFEKYKQKTPVIHLHGVDFTLDPIKDHLSLNKIPHDKFKPVLDLMNQFTGVVSLEVFSLENLIQSLDFLSQIYKDIPTINYKP